MAFTFHTYLTARDNFCYCYYGRNQELISQLIEIQQKLQKKYPQINIFLCLSEAKDQYKNIIHKDEFKNNMFLYYEELKINPDLNVLEEIIIENDL